MIKTVIEELKQRMLAKSAKVKRYEHRIEQFRQNRIFDLDQKKIYAKLNRNRIRSNDVSNTEECTVFGRYLGCQKRTQQRGRMIERYEDRE